MVVVAAPAQRMPRSARIHSTRVVAAMATRSSGCTPSECRPAAIALARSPTVFPLSHAIAPFDGYAKASLSGVAATRCRNMSGIDLYGACRLSVMDAMPPYGAPAAGRGASPGRGVVTGREHAHLA